MLETQPTLYANRSYAVEIAVDAHATRLLIQRSPPEACVDSSLGPYVTSILRGGTGTGNNADLIELLESHCQITPDAARDVLSSIALAVQTGDVSDHGGRSNGNINNGRSRSKSLGDEPAYDVNAKRLGKILQDAMIVEDPLLSCHINPSADMRLDTYCSHEGLNKSRSKGRSVTFDETLSSHGTNFGPPNQAGVSSSVRYPVSSLMGLSSSPATEEILEEYPFEPLEGILGVLDLEGEDENQRQAEQELGETNFGQKESELGAGQTNPVHENISRPKQARSNVHKSLRKEANDVATALFRTSRPRSNSLMDQPQCQSRKKEASDLAAALFRPPSRPRSNSFMDQPQCQSRKKEAHGVAAALFRPSRPRSSSLMDQHQSSSPGVLSVSSSSSGGSAAASSDVCFSSPSSTSFYQSKLINKKHASSDSNAAELNSTVQLLLTLNSHLGLEAASLASQLTDGDLNLAQYLIESARSDSSGGTGRTDSNSRQRRSRICRHELRGVCYRADCPYSHDLMGVTCLFWLKGRCRENNCRFFHGFAESLLEGICKEYLVKQQAKKQEKEGEPSEQKPSEKTKIHTSNLLYHNQCISSNIPEHELHGLDASGTVRETRTLRELCTKDYREVVVPTIEVRI
ncbi:LOW QUALITY PROTEIN: hypothetical protein ACHAXR_008027 [Thalassiosira sp. AJA248-18]